MKITRTVYGPRQPKPPAKDPETPITDHVITTPPDAGGYLDLCRECGAWHGDQCHLGCPMLRKEHGA